MKQARQKLIMGIHSSPESLADNETGFTLAEVVGDDAADALVMFLKESLTEPGSLQYTPVEFYRVATHKRVETLD